jgi:hypothetical protein
MSNFSGSSAESWAEKYPNSKPLSDIDYDRMKALEEYTDFEFSTTDKIKALGSGIADEAQKTENYIDEVAAGLTEGLKTIAVNVKYLPLIAIIVVSAIVYGKAKAI